MTHISIVHQILGCGSLCVQGVPGLLGLSGRGTEGCRVYVLTSVKHNGESESGEQVWSRRARKGTDAIPYRLDEHELAVEAQNSFAGLMPAQVSHNIVFDDRMSSSCWLVY